MDEIIWVNIFLVTYLLLMSMEIVENNWDGIKLMDGEWNIIMDYELWIMNCRLWMLDYEL
jgi:hypothetical protein